MQPKKKAENQISLFSSLRSTLDSKHPLFMLADRIDWRLFEQTFTPLYAQDTGRPAKPIRLMTGLLILKHLRNISDEGVVAQWSENLYYQYFCGEQVFQCGAPCEASELVHFLKRIGEKGVELILQESIRVNGQDGKDGEVQIDTTVQEKNITFPTDGKLHKRIIDKCRQIAQRSQIRLRQCYRRTIKQLGREQRFRNHPHNRVKALKADRKIKTIAGRLVRELERHLAPHSPYWTNLTLFKQVLTQAKHDKNKIYSLHEPEVCCIAKGKEHKKYEFGNKVSLVRTRSGVIVGAKGFRNPSDGHTLPEVLEQVARLTGKQLEIAVADRGYRGVKQVNDTQIIAPEAPRKSQSKYQRAKHSQIHRRRAAIEPIIGHLKQDHRLGRNFYKGVVGDNLNIMLTAAAFNFKRVMNKWKNAVALF